MSGSGGDLAADGGAAGAESAAGAYAGPSAGAGEEAAGTAGEAASEEMRLLLEGVAQKGPFIRGSSVVVSELDKALAQTGRSFNAQITDNSGRFYVSVTSLKGPFVRLSATGFYYNEVSGQLSTAPLALVALSELHASRSVNVNILTDLETPRVEYLVEHGSAFQAAKQQAQREVLEMFGIDLGAGTSSEALDVSGSSAPDAALLAASVLLQGYLNVGELTELLSSIAGDLREDGKLDEASSGALLMNAATLVDPSEVRQHMEQRYKDLGKQVALGKFEDYLAKFRMERAFPYVSRTVFPKTGAFGPNILAMADGTRLIASDGGDRSTWFSLAAIAPVGQRLRVQLTPRGAGDHAGYYGLTGLVNWINGPLDAEFGQDLTVVTPGILSDAGAPFTFPSEVTVRFDIFEGGRDQKTSKTITFTPRSH